MKKLSELLDNAFIHLSSRTNKRYRRWVCRLIFYHRVGDNPERYLHPTEMEQRHIDEFELHLIDDLRLSLSSVNQARRAINLFFEAIGKPLHLKSKSAKGRLKAVYILSESETQDIIGCLNEFYRQIAVEMYERLTPPEVACKKFFSQRGGAVHIGTMRKQIKRAAHCAGITAKHVTPKMLHQSGIVHQLRKTNNPALVAEKSGLSDTTIARYLRFV